MDYYSNLQITDWLSACIEIALFLTILIKIPIKRIKVSFSFCILISAIWHVSIPNTLSKHEITNMTFILLEGLRYLSWIILLTQLLMLSQSAKLPRQWSISLYSCSVFFLATFIYSLKVPLTGIANYSFWLYIEILLCLFAIVICEQLLRHDHSSRMTKLVALIAITLFSYDIIVFVNILIFDKQQDLWQARGFISSATSLILALSIIFYGHLLKEKSRFKLSNSVILFTTSLSIVGGFLILMALLGSAINFFDISWVNTSKIVLYVLTIFTIVALSFSEKIRLRIIVWTSKHFFAHKYDYKEQWIKLDALLSQKNTNKNCYDKSLMTMISLFSASGGGIWIKGQQLYSLISTKNINFDNQLPFEGSQSEFIQTLEKKDWVFQVNKYANAKDVEYNALLPEWLSHIRHSWIVVPLNTEIELIGFIVLCKNSLSTALTWEDLDLLKLTGRQIASYIGQEQAAEKLSHNQQFDMFNKITAFAIHDIKNLIAQQALVVKNAEKFKNHPDFIDDAIDTIATSVDKMDKLLIKLQGKSSSEKTQFSLHAILLEAIEMNSHRYPKPNLVMSGADINFCSDKDKLLMTINHLIKNAQDATPDNGKVEIVLSTENKEIWLSITDNGCGMNEDFIKNNLFQPFKSTKKDNGMGIGVYQIKEMVNSLNGELLVESTPNVGSKFSIFIPINQDENILLMS
jgi:putative PEP-CTERM system histidine kinase